MLRRMEERDVDEPTIELPVRFIHELSAALTLQDALNAVARWFSSMFRAERVSLTLVDTTTHLKLIAIEGNRAIPFDAPLSIDGTMVGRVFRTRTAEVCHDTARSTDWDCRKLAAGGVTSCLDAPLVNRGDCFGTLNVGFSGGARFTDFHLERMQAIASWIAANIRVHHQVEQLAALSSQDPLTGLLNRRAFDRESAALLGRCAAEDASFGLAVVDLDHFKSVNDRYGHATGDRVLISTAELLRECCRKGDIVARLGGEEFCVLLRGVDGDQLKAILRRFSIALGERGLVLDGRNETVTASIGAVVRSRGDEGVDFLLEQADQAMYRAKQSGRNRIEFAGD